MEALMSCDEVLAAAERLDSSDAAVAVRLARTVTDSESAAMALWDEAQARAAALAATLEFQRAVKTLAGALLEHRKLDVEAIGALLTEQNQSSRVTSTDAQCTR